MYILRLGYKMLKYFFSKRMLKTISQAFSEKKVFDFFKQEWFEIKDIFKKSWVRRGSWEQYSNIWE